MTLCGVTRAELREGGHLRLGWLRGGGHARRAKDSRSATATPARPSPSRSATPARPRPAGRANHHHPRTNCKEITTRSTVTPETAVQARKRDPSSEADPEPIIWVQTRRSDGVASIALRRVQDYKVWLVIAVRVLWKACTSVLFGYRRCSAWSSSEPTMRRDGWERRSMLSALLP